MRVRLASSLERAARARPALGGVAAYVLLECPPQQNVHASVRFCPSTYASDPNLKVVSSALDNWFDAATRLVQICDPLRYFPWLPKPDRPSRKRTPTPLPCWTQSMPTQPERAAIASTRP